MLDIMQRQEKLVEVLLGVPAEFTPVQTLPVELAPLEELIGVDVRPSPTAARMFPRWCPL